jgi:hypothetical protein
MPTQILIGLFDAYSFSGQHDKAPTLTSPIDVKRASLCSDGVTVRSIRADFDDDLYVTAYKHFTEWLGTWDSSTYMNFDIFKRGYRYLAFDLLEGCDSTPCDAALLSGIMDFSLEFDAPTPTPLTICVFYISPDRVAIGKDRYALCYRSVD